MSWDALLSCLDLMSFWLSRICLNRDFPKLYWWWSLWRSMDVSFEIGSFARFSRVVMCVCLSMVYIWTLPLAFDCLDCSVYSPSIDPLSLIFELVLIQRLCQYISQLFFGTYWMDWDELPVNICSEVPEFVVQMFCSGSELVESCDFQCSAVVLKDLAMNFRSSVVDVYIPMFHFFQYVHHRNCLS